MNWLIYSPSAIRLRCPTGYASTRSCCFSFNCCYSASHQAPRSNIVALGLATLKFIGANSGTSESLHVRKLENWETATVIYCRIGSGTMTDGDIHECFDIYRISFGPPRFTPLSQLPLSFSCITMRTRVPPLNLQSLLSHFGQSWHLRQLHLSQ